MKNITFFNNRNTNILVMLLAVFAISGCETTIPEPDTQLPEIRLTITGPGIGRQEFTNPPQDNWSGPGGVSMRGRCGR